MPAGRPPAAADTLQQLTTQPPPDGGPGADPTGTLANVGNPAIPHGAYASPWFSDGPGCCGPTGRNGWVGYELYMHTGPSLIFGNAPFTDRLRTGWMVGGGGRTLLFNQPGDAAWVVDLGLNYQYNRGTFQEVGLFIRQPARQNPITGQLQRQPDTFVGTRIRGYHRTAFTYGIGRDWWSNGPGNVGHEDGWNFRYGVDLGGRWGTSHVDLVPQSQVDVYSRRQKVFHGFYVGSHLDVEHPFGGWIWFGGLRVQYGVDWSDVAPPIAGDNQFVNILLSTGFRF